MQLLQIYQKKNLYFQGTAISSMLETNQSGLQSENKGMKSAQIAYCSQSFVFS